MAEIYQNRQEYKKILKIYERTVSEKDSDYVEVCNALADLYEDMEAYEKVDKIRTVCFATIFSDSFPH